MHQAVSYDPRLWWRDVPAGVRSRLDFRNVPVVEGDGDNTSSFLRTLVAMARPEDFVAVKAGA